MQESVIYQDWFQQGFQEGLTIAILSQLKRRINDLKSEDETRITSLSIEQLEALGDALLDFFGRDDLLAWLANN